MQETPAPQEDQLRLRAGEKPGSDQGSTSFTRDPGVALATLRTSGAATAGAQAVKNHTGSAATLLLPDCRRACSAVLCTHEHLTCLVFPWREGKIPLTIPVSHLFTKSTQARPWSPERFKGERDGQHLHAAVGTKAQGWGWLCSTSARTEATQVSASH